MKKKNIFSIFLIALLLIPNLVYADDFEPICSNNGVLTSFRFLGYILIIVKIVVPILLIVFASVDLSKAVIEGKEDSLKKSIQTLIQRVVLGVIIFLAPSIINAIFNLVDPYQGDNKRFSECRTCLFEPRSCRIVKAGKLTK